jgi:branched-chain amino acid transport system ATP-binding protein
MLLEVDGLHAAYGPMRVLHGLSFSIAPGSVTALLGANGAGKTTTLRALCGMVKCQGTIRFDGRRIERLPTEAIARRGISHVPDGRGTFTHLTVEENLRLGAHSRRDQYGIAADLSRMYRYFPRFNERRRQQAGTLSGGEQQMLALGRALMLRPRLLLLDEPSFGLAPRLVRELFEILAKINRENGVAVLLVEQNAQLALELADHAYLLETGSIALGGRSEEIRRNEAVRASYLGS